jgi:hypothetical protein
MNCPKHIEFHSKINLRNSASSWFYYKEICHDARSHERKKKIPHVCFKSLLMLRTKRVRKSGTYAHGVPAKQKHKKGGNGTRQGIRDWHIRTANSKVIQAVTLLTRTGVLLSMTPVARYFQSDCECYFPRPHCVFETGCEFQATRPKSLFWSVCDTYVTFPPRTAFVN